MTGSTVTGSFTGLTDTPTIIKQSSVASATGGDQFPVYFGVSVPNTLEPGQYTMAKDTNNNPGTIVYQLTMPIVCQPYVIKYDGNNNDAGTTMSVTNTVEENESTTLMPSNFKRAGYGFAGWNTKADGTGENFGPMETVTLSTTDTKGNELINSAVLNTVEQTREITLYAKWIQSQGNLQGWTGCNSMNIGDVTALTDTRDNNTYAIAKLADGNCWMIENLRLGGTTAMQLDSTNSNLASGATFTLNASQDPTQTAWCTDDNATCLDQSMLFSGNTTSPVSDATTPDANIYSYGNYYNWYSATAGTGTYAISSGNATASICPKGWRLPTGNTGGEYHALGAGFRAYPNNFIYSGSVNDAQFLNIGSYGRYWSSTVANQAKIYFLRFDSTQIYPGTYEGYKYNGFSVRCISEPPVTISDAYAKSGKTTHNGYYKMQDMNDSICGMVNVLDEPGQTQLIDTRDNKIYWATKLQDGHCWMTQNLDLNLSTSVTLTNANTDLNTVTSWTPARSTINAVTNTSTAGSITGWNNDNNTPYSVDTGDYYWNNATFYPSANCSYTVGGVQYQGCNYVTKADANWKNYFATTPYQSNGTHGHVGNYYNFSAAVASNNTSSYTANTLANIANNPPNSICPKGWRLPTITNASPDYTQANSRDEFSRLAYLYDNYTGNTSISSEGLEKAPLYMSRSGNVLTGLLRNAGYDEHYWSSTVSSSTIARQLGFNSGVVRPQVENTRSHGFSLRCLAR